MAGRFSDWLDDRTGYRQILHVMLEEPVPGGARLRYVFGSVLAYLFMQQVVLGILLAMYYSPSASDAWASTAYLNDQVTGGWFLRGLHHHGSSAMVVVTVLHMLQVVIAGAYRRPREFNWWTGLLMGGLVLAFALTGYLLPWDQLSMWAVTVGTNMAAAAPVVGHEGPFSPAAITADNDARALLLGGPTVGGSALLRFYILHCVALPLALGLGCILHFWRVRRDGGISGPAGTKGAG